MNKSQMTASQKTVLILFVITVIACNVTVVVILRTLLEIANENGEPFVEDGTSREIIAALLGFFVMTFCFCCCCCFCCGGRACGIKDNQDFLNVKSWRRKKIDKIVVVPLDKQAQWISPRPSITESGQSTPGYYPFIDYESKFTPPISAEIVEARLLADLRKKSVVFEV